MDVFLYSDYRDYLRDVYKWRKKALHPYSYSRFSESMGLGDRTFIQHILAGKRELPFAALEHVIGGLELNGEAAEHFRNLHGFAVSKNAADKDAYWRKIRTRLILVENQADLASERAEILEYWYGTPVKELLCSGITDSKELQKKMRHPLSVSEIEFVIQRLVQLGFVGRSSERSCFRDLDPEIAVPTTGPFAAIVRQFQKEMCLRSAEVMELSEKEEREFQTLTFSLSQKAFEQARDLIRQSRDALLHIYSEDQDVKEKVYQVNLTAFPLADLPLKRGLK